MRFNARVENPRGLSVGVETTASVPVEAVDISKTFDLSQGKYQALAGVSLRVPPSHLMSIVGPSGSGKSTILQCLAGLTVQSSGRVSLFGEDLSTLRVGQIARLYRRKIGFIFQSYNLVPTLSVWENVALPRRLDGQRRFAKHIDEALAKVGMVEKGRSMPSQLSGGEQQRVAVARALSTKPAIVFADEPTGALDSENSAQVLTHLRDLASNGSSVVLVTHDLEAASLADSSIVLRDGRIVERLDRPSSERILESLARHGAHK